MTGQATARVDIETLGSAAAVAVSRPGQPGLMLVDGRVPYFSDEQVEKAAVDLAKRAGPIVAAVRTKTESNWDEVRAECNRLAGGEASMRVKILAHHALRAHQALELQTIAAGLAFGTENEVAEKHMRNQAGLAVVASDALNKLYEAAREEGKAKLGTGPVGQLMTRLGVGQAVADGGGGPGRLPDLTPHPPLSGSLPSSNRPPSEKDPSK